MKTSKLFHVLVLAGGALAVGCSSEPSTPGPAQTSAQRQAAGKDADGGADDTDTDKETTPPQTPPAGSKFW